MCKALRRTISNMECPFTLEELSDKPAKKFVVWDETTKRRYWFSAEELAESVMNGIDPENPFTQKPFQTFEIMRLLFLTGHTKDQVMARLRKPAAAERDTSLLQFNVTTVMQKLTDIISRVSLPVERFNHILPFVMSDLQQELCMVFREDVEVYARTFQRMTRALTALAVEPGSAQETNKMTLTMWLMDTKDNVERQPVEPEEAPAPPEEPRSVLVAQNAAFVLPTRLLNRSSTVRTVTIRRRVRRFAGQSIH